MSKFFKNQIFIFFKKKCRVFCIFLKVILDLYVFHSTHKKDIETI